MGNVLGRRSMACALVTAALATALAMAFAVSAPASALAAQDDLQLTTSAAKKATTSTGAIESGEYYIESRLASTLSLSIKGSSSKAGANAQLAASKGKASQRWRIDQVKDGTYTITNVGSGMRLASADKQPWSGANAEQAKANNSAAQRWTIKKSSGAYVIASAADSGYVLDVDGAYSYSGTNVQLYESNGTNAQKWWLVPAKAKPASEQTVEDGIYELHLASASKYVLEVAGSKYGNNANVQLHKATSAVSQRWDIRWDGKYYTVRNLSSGKMLAADASSPIMLANVLQNASMSKAAQRWAIVEKSSGTYQFVNKATGLALDIAGAKAANGTNARMYYVKGGASQRFELKACKRLLPEGFYTIYTRLSPAGFAIGTKGMSAKKGSVVRLRSAENSVAQRVYLSREEGDIYSIQLAGSGYFLTDAKGKVVQKAYSGAKSQQWRAIQSGGAIAFRNVASGKLLTVSGGKAAAGTKLVTKKATSGKAQRFRLVSGPLVPEGYYTVKNMWGAKMLDVDGASTSEGANVQTYKNNDTAAQTWYFKHVRNGYYKIANDGSGLALGVKKASKKSGADVRQYTYDGSDSQLWEAQLTEDGRIMFVNKASGMVLSAAGKKSGSNVRQASENGRSAQEWKLEATESKSLSGDPELDNMVRKALSQIGYGGDRLKKAFYWVAGYRYASGSKYPKGNWSIPFAKEMFTYGAGNCYRFAATFCWIARGLGYNAAAVSGYVPYAGGGWAPHGWVEVYYNGTTYVCDPDLAHELPSHNWYWVTYASAPTTYTW